MIYSESFLENVRSFGILGYSVDKIIDLTEPENEALFRIDFSTPGSVIFKAYRKGKTTGEYNLDKKLFDKATKSDDTLSNTILEERMERQKTNNKIYENFGL